MSFIYTIINSDLNKLKEMGYQILPEEICEAPKNENYYYKEVIQPKDGVCVNGLIKMYQDSAKTICENEKFRKLHRDIGIRFRKVNGEYKLIVTDTMVEMFRHWRIELDIENKEVYFTISDGAVPSFYDAENVLDAQAPKEVKELIEAGIIEKVEIDENGNIIEDNKILDAEIVQ